MELIKSRFFKITELVSPEILAVLSEPLAWRLIPYSVINSLDNLRRIYGAPIIINNRDMKQCGIRAKNCTVGAPMSDHKVVNYNRYAFDLHVTDREKLIKIVRENNISLGISRMENPAKTEGWLHITITDTLLVGELDEFDP